MSTLNDQPLTALVTGATSGLGKEVALRLARDDLQVIVVGRDAARGAAVVAQIEAAGGQARFIAADLSDPADIKRLAAEVVTSMSWSTTPAVRSGHRRKR